MSGAWQDHHGDQKAEGGRDAQGRWKDEAQSQRHSPPGPALAQIWPFGDKKKKAKDQRGNRNVKWGS